MAKFNVSTNQSDSFKGVPSPAAGLVIASFPLIIHQYVKLDADSWLYNPKIPQLLINVWFLYAAIMLVSYLMICNRTFIAIKFKDYSLKNNLLKYILISISLICIVALQWLAIPIIFILYLIFSAFSRVPPTVGNVSTDKTLDITA